VDFAVCLCRVTAGVFVDYSWPSRMLGREFGDVPYLVVDDDPAVSVLIVLGDFRDGDLVWGHGEDQDLLGESESVKSVRQLR